MSDLLPNLPQLAAYLAKKHWTEKAGKKRLTFSTGDQSESGEVSYRIFEHPRVGDADTIRIVLPVRPDGNTPRRYIESALNALAGFYKMSAVQIATAILTSNIDVLFGIHPRSSVSLSRAQEIITNLKNVISQAANAEHEPKPYSAAARGNKIVDDVNFGHTFAGSFGFRVECPLSTTDRQMEFGGDQPKPLERRLLERLAIGFLTVEAAVDANDIGPVCDNYRSGFTANICDALLDLCEPSDTEPFSFQFEWSSMVPVAAQLQDKPLAFKINARRYAVIQESSAALKRMVVEPKTKLVGSVVGLNSDVPPLQQGLMAHRKVTLSIISGDHDKSKMQLEVSDGDYQIALDSHTRGVLVEVEGVPTQRGTHWRIEDHSGLRQL